MRLIPGTEINTVEACTAHDGTWAMKREYFELSMKWGKKAFDGMTESIAGRDGDRLPALGDSDRAGDGSAADRPDRGARTRVSR